MGASASAINKDEIIARELEKPADGSDLTEGEIRTARLQCSSGIISAITTHYSSKHYGTAQHRK